MRKILMLGAIAFAGPASAASINGHYAFTGTDTCILSEGGFDSQGNPQGSLVVQSDSVVTGTAVFSGTTATITQNVGGTYNFMGGSMGSNVSNGTFALGLTASGNAYIGTETAGTDVGTWTTGMFGGSTYLNTGQGTWTIVPSGSSGRNQDLLMFTTPVAVPASETWSFSGGLVWNAECFRSRSMTKVDQDDTN